MAVSDKTPRLPSSPLHPDYALFRQLLTAVGRLDQWDDTGTRNVAAALYVQVRHNPQMHKVDQVVLGDPNAPIPSVFALHHNKTVNQVIRASVPTDAAFTPANHWLQEFALSPSHQDRGGFLQDPAIQRNPVRSLGHGPLVGPNALVLSLYDATDAQAALQRLGDGHTNPGRDGAHFLIERNGTIHQVASLHEWTRHIRPALPAADHGGGLFQGGAGSATGVAIPPGQHGYPVLYPTTTDSIGIHLLGRQDPGTGQWDPVTARQTLAATHLLHALKAEFGLDDNDIYRHAPVPVPFLPQHDLPVPGRGR